MTVTITTRNIIFYWVLFASGLLLTLSLIAVGVISKYSFIAQFVKSGLEVTAIITAYWLVAGSIEWIERRFKAQ